MKSFILLEKSHEFELPEKFRDDDVRYTESLMGRSAYGIEFDEQRATYIRSQLHYPEHLIHGDSRQLSAYDSKLSVPLNYIQGRALSLMV